MTFYFFGGATPASCGNSQAGDQTHATVVTRAVVVTMLNPYPLSQGNSKTIIFLSKDVIEILFSKL